MKTEFKLIRAVKIYEETIVEAESQAAALALFDSGECGGWEEDDVSASEPLGLISVETRGPDGYFSIRHDVQSGTTRHRLSESDASEIFYALDSKRLRILNGDYGGSDPELDPAAWAEHLNEIMAKIGPDGVCLVGIEFDGEGDDDES